jgi:hypothetical protein
VLPSWFAEYALNLDVMAVILCALLVGYGLTVASTGRFGLALKDASRSRRPTAVVAAISAVAGSALVGIAAGSQNFHLRLTESALASLLLLFALAAAPYCAVTRVWTNKFWRLPEAASITGDQVRVLGRVQVVLWSGFSLALVGSIAGLAPKLAYIEDARIRSLLLVSDIALIMAGAVLVVRAWRLFRSLRIRQTEPRQPAQVVR